MWRLVTVGVKGNVPWTDDVTRRTSYSKRAFPPMEHNNDGRKGIHRSLRWELETKAV